jgi:Predicted methylated DNA-protein cysteine methyltransferase
MQELSQRIISVISAIPIGKVATYGQIATLAGQPRAARQVARLLHSSSDKYDLPWHRVINAQGHISLSGTAGKKQALKLRVEGIEIMAHNRIDLAVYQWKPSRDD